MATANAASFVQFSTDGSGLDPVTALHEFNARDIVFRLDPLAGRTVHADIVVHSRPAV